MQWENQTVLREALVGKVTSAEIFGRLWEGVVSKVSVCVAWPPLFFPDCPVEIVEIAASITPGTPWCHFCVVSVPRTDCQLTCSVF